MRRAIRPLHKIKTFNYQAKYTTNYLLGLFFKKGFELSIEIRSTEIEMVAIENIIPNPKNLPTAEIYIKNKINKKVGLLLVDFEDFKKLNLKTIRLKNWYAFDSSQSEYVHRILFKAKMVDHINRNTLDCRKSNLRATCFSMNKANSKPHGDRKYKGVQSSRKRFKAVVRFKGKYEHIGTFDTGPEAALAYNKKAKEYFGEFARINNV